MSDDVTVYAVDEMRLFGNVVVAGNDQVACVMHDDGIDQFAMNHDYTKPGRVQLFFNEKDELGNTVTRCFDFDPIKFNHALTRLVREAKIKKEDSFV